MDNAEVSDFTLPAAPSGLSFDKNDFVKSHFSVDDFLDDHKGIPLEVMRDDLGAYLKVLRLAMIDLINKDYANFVSLSATLIRFDEWILQLEQPLTELSDEVIHVSQNVEETMKELSLWINQKKSLHQKKVTLHYYIETQKHLKVLSKTVDTLCREDIKKAMFCAERAVFEYNKLQFCMSKCNEMIKTQDQIKAVDLGEKLYDKLLEALIVFNKENKRDDLLNTLHTLAVLNKISDTEEFVRRKMFAIALQDIISESCLQIYGLNGIYEQVLKLLDNEFQLILTTERHPKLSSLPICYNFIIRSFWFEVERQLEVQLSSIFAPGNPNMFYSRYNDSIKFLNNLEKHFWDKQMIKSLKTSNEYKSFMKRWNLPVYFQIRFQEIAASYEAVLNECIAETKNKDDFILTASASCWEALEKCWKNGIYIEAIMHKFWKLTLQIISRYAHWVTCNCQSKVTNDYSEATTINKQLIKQSYDMYLDINKIIDKLPDLFDHIKTMVHKPKIIVIVTKNMEESINRLKEVEPVINTCMVNEICKYCASQLKQVSDIPRLYRKTNRSVPSTPCNYINVVKETITGLRNDFGENVDSTFIQNILLHLFSQTTSIYYKSVEDVLTSVQKTEESLRRLKQIRHGNFQHSSESGGGISDGDKIRMQLNIDVNSYCNLIKSADIDLSKVEYANKLVSLVENIVNK